MRENKAPFWVPRVRAIMKKKGLTLDDLVDAMKVKTRGAVGHYFSGRRQMSMDRMVVLANIIGIDIKEMIHDPQQRTIKETPAGYNTEGSTVPVVFMCPVISFKEIRDYIKNHENHVFSDDVQFVSLATRVSNKAFAVTLSSDNMVSSTANHITFLPGDVIIFDPEADPQVNDYVLCEELRTGSFLFRQLCSEGSKSFLKALNVQYNYLSYDINEVRIVSVAIARLNLFRK